MDDAISRSAMLQDLDAWRNQLGIYTGDDPHELELWETVGTMLVQFSDNVLSAPAIDAVQVVRCKDCKFRGDGFYCPLVISVGGNIGRRELDNALDDDFCSRGARMDGDENE